MPQERERGYNEYFRLLDVPVHAAVSCSKLLGVCKKKTGSLRFGRHLRFCRTGIPNKTRLPISIKWLMNDAKTQIIYCGIIAISPSAPEVPPPTVFRKSQLLRLTLLPPLAVVSAVLATVCVGFGFSLESMGCGASSSDPSQGGKVSTLHSKIRWFNPDDEPSAKQVHIEHIIKLLPKYLEKQDTQNGNVAMHIAAQNGHYEIVDLLISRGANLNAKNFSGNTPLHMSMEYGFDNVSTLLLQKGAGPKIKNDEGNFADTGIEGTKVPLKVDKVSAPDATK